MIEPSKPLDETTHRGKWTCKALEEVLKLLGEDVNNGVNQWIIDHKENIDEYILIIWDALKDWYNDKSVKIEFKEKYDIFHRAFINIPIYMQTIASRYNKGNNK